MRGTGKGGTRSTGKTENEDPGDLQRGYRQRLHMPQQLQPRTDNIHQHDGRHSRNCKAEGHAGGGGNRNDHAVQGNHNSGRRPGQPIQRNRPRAAGNPHIGRGPRPGKADCQRNNTCGTEECRRVVDSSPHPVTRILGGLELPATFRGQVAQIQKRRLNVAAVRNLQPIAEIDQRPEGEQPCPRQILQTDDDAGANQKASGR